MRSARLLWRLYAQYLLIALVALARGRAWRRCGAALVAGFAGMCLGAPGPVADGMLHVSVLDVGQGDAIVVRSPNGRVAVVDAGARYPSGHDVGERVVSDFIWQRNPWGLYDTGNPAVTYPGIDYLAAYWMGRFNGHLGDDTPGLCLAWR